MIVRALLLCAAAWPALPEDPAVRERGVAAIRQELASSDGSTVHTRVAALLEEVRLLGGKAAAAGETLAAMLGHRHPLYRGRDKSEVTRLRSRIFVTLSEIGVPPSAVPPLLDTLAHFDVRSNPAEYGAAVRAAGTLGPRGRRFVAYLLPVLVEPMSEVEFSLVRYEPTFARREATTLQVEIARCLGAIASPEDGEALAVLREMVRAGDKHGADQRAAAEARTAIARIEQRGTERGGR